MDEFIGLDFAAAWQDFTDRRHRAARTDEGDQAMWASFAEQYDERTRFSDGIQAHLESLVCPGDTVLDVGAGTGRMALPLARIARQVTALDHSSAMLDVLQRKMIQHGIGNIDPVETTWQQAEVEPHDVVIAIWSLYRQPAILTALQKLVNATRRTLVIADGDSGLKPPHEVPHAALLQEIWGVGGDGGIPNYLYFAGMLWQLGVRADVRVIYEQRIFQGVTPGEIARHLSPAHATPEEIALFAVQAAPLFHMRDNGYTYKYSVPVGLITWTRP